MHWSSSAVARCTWMKFKVNWKEMVTFEWLIQTASEIEVRTCAIGINRTRTRWTFAHWKWTISMTTLCLRNPDRFFFKYSVHALMQLFQNIVRIFYNVNIHFSWHWRPCIHYHAMYLLLLNNWEHTAGATKHYKMTNSNYIVCAV